MQKCKQWGTDSIYPVFFFKEHHMKVWCEHIHEHIHEHTHEHTHEGNMLLGQPSAITKVIMFDCLIILLHI